jgi:hypothetical protein
MRRLFTLFLVAIAAPLIALTAVGVGKAATAPAAKGGRWQQERQDGQEADAS